MKKTNEKINAPKRFHGNRPPNSDWMLLFKKEKSAEEGLASWGHKRIADKLSTTLRVAPCT